MGRVWVFGSDNYEIVVCDDKEKITVKNERGAPTKKVCAYEVKWSYHNGLKL